MRVRPYILAGGRSSRMGKDKAMLLLGGRTLLGRAVDTLREIPILAENGGPVRVTIVGARTELEGADRIIVDRYPGCGPLGGIEAALRDLEEDGEGDYAFFLPLDMPFLPAGLIKGLLGEWIEASHRGAVVCQVTVDGRPQPLVSMVHKTLHRFIAEALTAGQLRVTPVLQSGAVSLASSDAGDISYEHSRLHTTRLDSDPSQSTEAGWIKCVEPQALRRLWFSNLNSKEDFKEAETFAARLGSS